MDNKLIPNVSWRTKSRGHNEDEYQLYLDLASDGNGNDAATGKKLKTYNEWLES